MYWAQVFVLPKKVLHEIEQVCRTFLWHGVYFSGWAWYKKGSDLEHSCYWQICVC